MVKRSIEQDLRNKNFGARNGNYEKNAVVKNQGTKQRVQKILGDCWQWESNGQCIKGDNCSFRHDVNKRGKMTQSNTSPNSPCSRMSEKHREPEVPEKEVPVVECLDGLARITLKELAITHFVKKWLPPECLFYKTKSGCRFGEKCSYARRQVDEQPTKRSKKNDDKSAVAMLKKCDWHEREPVTDQCHDRPGKPGKKSDKKCSSSRHSSEQEVKTQFSHISVTPCPATSMLTTSGRQRRNSHQS